MNESVQSLFQNSDLSDLKIICEGKEFPCHKLLLALRSSVFKRMFSSDLKLSEAEDDSVLKIDDISPDVMEVFLKFLYTDELKREDINASLLMAANKYDLKRLVNLCVKHFEANINTENVMEIAVAAYLVENDQLLQKASKFIIDNVGALKEPEDWNQVTKTYPHIATKVMNLIMFQKRSSI